jgi:UDP-glucuronate decarboxylase
MSKILVTGGAGFIGSHLCQRLLNENHEVICIDNMISGQIENIQSFVDHPKFTFSYGDVTEHSELDKVDEIYNLACPDSPKDFQATPVETVKTNVVGVINLLELANKSNAKILQASTSEVYGFEDQNPAKESLWGHVNTMGERSCYDESKRCAETLFHEYHKKFGVEIKIARIFNTYGPHMRINDGRVVSNFITQAINHEKLAINGHGEHTRSFCYVEDIVDGLIKLMSTDKSITGPVNIGNPKEISINDLAKKILDLTNSPSQITYLDISQNDPEHRCPDISLAKDVLNWEPLTDLDTGLKKTIEYFNSLL